MSNAYNDMEPLSNVTNTVSMGVKTPAGKPEFPVCIVEGDYITTFDNHTSKAVIEGDRTLLSADGRAFEGGTYAVFLGSTWKPGKRSPWREVALFIPGGLYFMNTNGDDLVFEDVGRDPIDVPLNEWNNLTDASGCIVAKVTR